MARGQPSWRAAPLALALQLLLSLRPGLALRGICWGDASRGGNCEHVDLTGVTHVQSNWYAFVAWDNQTGRTVCWGEAQEGGDCRGLGLNLTGRSRVYSTYHAFVALNEAEGTAICWGDASFGGECAGLNFTGVTEVHSTRYAFLAVSRHDGRAFCWGDPTRGGSCDGLNLSGFDEVHSSWGVFLARSSASGQVHCWGSGDSYYAGPTEDCDRAAELAGGPRLIMAAPHAFAALGHGGTGHCWGLQATAGCQPKDLAGAEELHSTRYAFLARGAGEARCWGDPNKGGRCGGRNLTGLGQVYTSWGVFLAVSLSDGRASCWGSDSEYYGGPPTVCDGLNFTGITEVVASPHAFAAVDGRTGRTLCWGDPKWGGRCPAGLGDRPIRRLYATRYAFLALPLGPAAGKEELQEEELEEEEALLPQGYEHWLWTFLSVTVSAALLGAVWLAQHKRHVWDRQMPIQPWVEKKVSQLRSRSGSFQFVSPSLASLWGGRTDAQVARAALEAAGGPAYWGVTVRQLQSFYEEHRSSIEDYCRCHRLDSNFCHVCLEDPCPCFHGDADHYPYKEVEEDAKASLSPMLFNMHLVVQLIIKPKTKDNLGILGYWAMFNALCPLKVQTFISHCWNHDFGGFVKAISTLGPDTVVWVCSFALPQNIDTNKVVGACVMRSPFAAALTAAEKVCLVVDERVEALTRSWCCFELYLSLSRRIELDIRAPVTSATTYQRILDRAASMDVRHCRASNQADHNRILRVLRGTEDAVNRKVRQQIEQLVRLLAAALSHAQVDLEAPRRSGHAPRAHSDGPSPCPDGRGVFSV